MNRIAEQNQGIQSPAVRGNANLDSVSSYYALLLRLAALDVELANSAVQTGIAVDLTFPKDATGFASADSAPQSNSQFKRS
jgi:hypothetical protein